MKTYTKEEIESAHKFSQPTKEDIENSKFCGCFYCCRSFRPKDKPIEEWVGKEPHYALCPYCGIDSVLAGISGLPINDKDFLKQMYNHWFAIYKGGKDTGEIFGGKK